ncbi:putative ribonuclease H-like domain-containing protein [Tanacetum coccineum]
MEFESAQSNTTAKLPILKLVSTANFSDNTVYAFMVENPNGSILLQKEKFSLMLMDTAGGYDKLQVECCKLSQDGTFARRGCRETQGTNEGRMRFFLVKKLQFYKREVVAKGLMKINVLKSKFEKVKQEKEGIEFKIEKFDNASKSLNKLLESQITGKSKNGLGLDEFKDPEFKSYGSEDSKQKSNIVCDKKSDDSKENSDDSLVKEQVLEDTSSFVESSLNVEKETVILDKKIEFVKPKNHEKPVKKSVSFDHVQAHCKYHQRERMVYGNNYNRVDYNYTTNMTHPNAQRNMVPRVVLMKTSLKPFNTATTVNTAHPKSIVFSAKPMSLFSKSAQSTARRPYQSKTVLTNKTFTQTNNTARPKAVNTARPHSAVVNAVRVNQANGKPQQDNTGFIDSGCSRHMTGNITYLSYFKEFDRGYVTFGGGAHGGRISSKGTLKTDSLDFKDSSKPHNKTPYEFLEVLNQSLNFMRPFGCSVTIPNTLDNLGKFDGKSDEGFFAGYSLSSKAFRVYNIRTRRVEENLHIGFLENKSMIEGNGPKWLFDIDSLTQSINYDVGNGEPKSAVDDQKQDEDGPHNESDEKDKSEDDSSPKEINAARQHVNTASRDETTINTASSKDKSGASPILEATHLEYFNDEDEPEVDLGNILSSYTVPTTPNTRIHKDYPIKNVIGDVNSSVQTRRMSNPTSEQGFISAFYEGKTHEDLHTCLFACFLSQEEPNRITKALSDPAWVEAMHEELVLFKLQKVWILMDLPKGYTQEEGIDYDDVFAPVARIEAIRLFLAYASFMGFMVYQMDVKSAFLYGQIEEEVYVCQPLGFEDPDYPEKVYKVVKALYGLHQAPRAWYETLANYLLANGFQRGKIDQTLFIKRQKGEIFLVQVYVDDIIFGSTNKELCTGFEKLMKENQDKYVDKILKKFNYTDVKFASTLVDFEKPLVKYGDADDVDVHLYRSMTESLMYLTTSKPDIIDSPFELVAYTDSDYARATQDRKSTTRGCQFLGNRLISWKYKNKTMVATSITEAKYVAAAS